MLSSDLRISCRLVPRDGMVILWFDKWEEQVMGNNAGWKPMSEYEQLFYLETQCPWRN